MNPNRRKSIEMEERRVQRRGREDAAGKLADHVPDLESLSLDIREARPDGVTNDTQYIRRVVVANAPALFEVPCSLKECEGGGYDLTREILGALQAHEKAFEGEVSCRGMAGPVECTRVLRYQAKATYTAKPSS